MNKKNKFLYGPVPSRRLGLSLGIDIVNDNLCSYDCVYCQLGRTKKKTLDRKPYLPVEPIIKELVEKLNSRVSVDYITLAGSGEPILNSNIGILIHEIKKHTAIPVAVITNGSQLSDKQVQIDLLEADLVLPSLDAHDQAGFEQINRPHHDIRFETMLKGLIDFSSKFKGEIRLEILILDGVNDTEADALLFKQLTEKISPERIQINTAMRPPAEPSARQASQDSLNKFCSVLGSSAEVIASFKGKETAKGKSDIKKEIQNILARRPCTVDDLASGLQVDKEEVVKQVESLVRENKILKADENGRIYYQVNQENK